MELILETLSIKVDITTTSYDKGGGTEAARGAGNKTKSRRRRLGTSAGDGGHHLGKAAVRYRSIEPGRRFCIQRRERVRELADIGVVDGSEDLHVNRISSCVLEDLIGSWRVQTFRHVPCARRCLG